MTNRPSPEPHTSDPRPSHPPRNAFVLKFADDAGPQSGLFRGRVEHVTSGKYAAFQSTEELWAFVRSVLAPPDDGMPGLPSGRGTDAR